MNLYAFCGNNGVWMFDKDGRAHFKVRRLSYVPIIVPYMSFAPIIGLVPALILDLGLADKLNIEILHEQLFYNDGSNIGYGAYGFIINESSNDYVQRRDKREYDDCIMKQAEERVKRNLPPYSLIGIGTPKFNCQDYADSLRRMYDQIKNEKDVKCKCLKKR